MRIIVLGCTGQVGAALHGALSDFDGVLFFDKNRLDLRNPRIGERIQALTPDVIINAAAFTNVDAAEERRSECNRINATAVSEIAQVAKELGALFISYSSDYVFDGKKQGKYLETDQPNPLSVYGKSKLEGDNSIIQSGCKHIIFRTSWVFSPSHKNFVGRILDLAFEKTELKIVDDQIGAPTSANLIAQVTVETLKAHITKNHTGNEPLGIFNLTSSRATTWLEFAKYIIEFTREMGFDLPCKASGIHGVSTKEYGAKADRPLNSQLDCSRIEKAINIRLPTWQSQIDPTLRALIQKGHLNHAKRYHSGRRER